VITLPLAPESLANSGAAASGMLLAFDGQKAAQTTLDPNRPQPPTPPQGAASPSGGCCTGGQVVCGSQCCSVSNGSQLCSRQGTPQAQCVSAATAAPAAPAVAPDGAAIGGQCGKSSCSAKQYCASATLGLCCSVSAAAKTCNGGACCAADETCLENNWWAAAGVWGGRRMEASDRESRNGSADRPQPPARPASPLYSQVLARRPHASQRDLL
jgi:hypothetical protein